MAINLFNVLDNELSDDVIGKIGAYLNEPPVRTKDGLAKAIPAILCALHQKTATTAGQNDLFGMLQRGGFDGRLPDNLGKIASSPGGLADLAKVGGPLLATLFGARQSPLIDWLASAAGLSKSGSTSLLGSGRAAGAEPDWAADGQRRHFRRRVAHQADQRPGRGARQRVARRSRAGPRREPLRRGTGPGAAGGRQRRSLVVAAAPPASAALLRLAVVPAGAGPRGGGAPGPAPGPHGFFLGDPGLCQAGSVRDPDLVVDECFQRLDRPGSRESRSQRVPAGLSREHYAIHDHRSR